MFRRGELISAREGAIVASIPRQTVARWLREDGLKTNVLRLQYLARAQCRAQLYAEGKPQRQKPSKSELRRIADKALRNFNRVAKQKRMATAASRNLDA